MTLEIIIQKQRYIRQTKTGAKFKYTGRCDLGHIDRTGEGGKAKCLQTQKTLKIQRQEPNTNTKTGAKNKDRSQIQRQEPNTKTGAKYKYNDRSQIQIQIQV